MAILAALEAKGISGSAATKEFRTAVTTASKGGTTLTKALGLTDDELANYTSRIASATGITQTYADAANTQYGIMDKLKHKYSELTLTMGSYLEPMEPILGAMTALGPMMLMLSTTAGQSAIKWGLNTAALVTHKAALIAMTGPIKALAAAETVLQASFLRTGVAAMKSVAGLIAAAAAKVWSWASAIPLGAGIPLAIAAIAAMAASIFALRSKLSGLAEGGLITKGGAFIVGEKGKELVNLPVGSAVTPLPAGAGAVGGITNNFYFENMTVRSEADIEAIAEKLYRKQKAAERSWGIKRGE